MTSWSLRPARRARKAPALWMPSCELPASRITASLIFSGRRSARSADGAAEGVAAREPRFAVGFSLLFGASGFGVVEVSFTLKNTLSKERRESTGNVSRPESGNRKPERRRDEGGRRKGDRGRGAGGGGGGRERLCERATVAALSERRREGTTV